MTLPRMMANFYRAVDPLRDILRDVVPNTPKVLIFGDQNAGRCMKMAKPETRSLFFLAYRAAIMVFPIYLRQEHCVRAACEYAHLPYGG